MNCLRFVSAALSCALLVFSSVGATLAAEPAKSPEEQQKLFHLPPGFEIQLVLSDPDIGQPMNLNFDARGRLWVTSSVEYPYPANGPGVQPRPERFQGGDNKAPRDWVVVVDGFEENGNAKKVTRFVSGLNIPIGETPIGAGDEAIVYSIPNIDKIVDTDGDGVADERTKLYGSIGNVDTHGMSNGYTPWIDGWIYGCHGFSNTSEITDEAGHVTKMQSGNTYRFRKDGSRFEQFTYGQVNPFGMTFDPLGNLYDADCHSMPVYLLLRGALYPHFGNQPDALGFGPTMIDHNHGSTGICGPAYYAANQFPADFHDNIFICNPVSQVVHRDKLKRFGSTYLVDSQPDMVTCDDTWFRPVDVMVGPNGALYIADFYNPIIGHYESPLEHPDRDRTHGRVWRVVYTGEGAAPLPDSTDITKLNVDGLIDKLDDPNLLVRTLATNLLVDNFAGTASDALRARVTDLTPWQVAHGLWVVERLDGIEPVELEHLSIHEEAIVRVHTMRALAERPEWNELEFRIVREALSDEDAFVVRTAADALGRHPDVRNVSPLIAAWNKALPEDTHLVYTIRLALREHFRSPGFAQAIQQSQWSKAQLTRLIEMAKVSETGEAAEWLIVNTTPETLDWEVLRRVARQASQQSKPAMLERVVELVSGKEPWQQLAVLREFTKAEQEAGRRPSENAIAKQWADQLVGALSGELSQPDAWTFARFSDASVNKQNPWAPRSRKKSTGESAEFLDSIVNGEKNTGILRSRPFVLPAEVSFWMCGQDGYPNQPDAKQNYVQLKLVDNGTVISKHFGPRNDTAHQFTFKTDEHAGKRGYIEIVDGNSSDSWAWIAVQGFSPEVPAFPVNDQRGKKDDLWSTIAVYSVQGATADLERAIESDELPIDQRLGAARLLLGFDHGDVVLPKLTIWLQDANTLESVRSDIAKLLGSLSDNNAQSELVAAMQSAAAIRQAELALALTQRPEGVSALIDGIEAGKASAYVLQDPRVQQQIDQLKLTDDLTAKIGQLKKDLPAREQQVQDQIDRLIAAVTASDVPAEVGAKSFEKRCATCHKLGNQGQLIGPQLDGVGIRPVARIVEDVVDPSRNVDAAFRTVLIQTFDGQIISGLPRREEGEILVLANSEGKEIRIAKEDIDLQKSSPLSLMPSNFVEQIPQEEFVGLIRYLKSQQSKPAAE
ncbi:hypothetical protein DTL21_00560 [Bremerella cremea]|uniref:Cytochrome c domain-containing protein n=1 Tax=Blastopirellula marina TaxID=124 RepID=A0A2S8G8M1_9BACT|nr:MULTISPECIES: PVC-type heme-binding CxxCH protein [Pirellulaceae]PQO40464.1 hypothetical protein C5Y83_00560 [Blastopirellula marina]RCS52046.1 hypothetical protein DTL21_00560 [Bremerella cremea]